MNYGLVPADADPLLAQACFGYRPGPAADARRRIVDFLDAHLRG